MSAPLLAARFVVPDLPKILVRRQKLLDRLSAGVQGPVTLLIGPSGAGKTVLAAQWAAEGRGPGPTAWLTAELDEPPGTFWAYVVEAFRHHGVAPPEEIGGPILAGDEDRSVLARLAAWLAGSPKPIVLVLDQLDTASSPEIAAGVHFLLRHAFPGLRLVVTARSEPLPGLHRFRTAGRLTEIRNPELRLTTAETSALLRQQGLELSDADLQALDRRTEGWAEGLQLCAMAMKRVADPAAFVREFTADQTPIADFLRAEVFDPQSPAAQELLLRTAVCDRVHPGLANALTDRDDTAWLLSQLEGGSAFVERVDGSPWYHVHPLFAEVLRSQLRVRRPGLERSLHRRAARWFADVGRPLDAVAQATTAGDWRFAAVQVVDGLEIGRLFAGPDRDRLAGLFAAMPRDPLEPAQSMVGAACRLADGDVRAGRADLRRADGQLTGGPVDPRVRLSRLFLELLADRLIGAADEAETVAQKSFELLDRVQPQLVNEHPEIPALLLTGLGSAQLGAGRYESAEATLAQAAQACGRPGTEQPYADSLIRLALIHLDRGHLRRAEQYADRALAVAERADLPPGCGRRLPSLVLADIGVERDDLTAAQSRLELETAPAEPGEDLVAKVTAAVIQSRLALVRGDWKTAVAVLHAVRLPEGTCGWATDQLVIAESAAALAHGDTGAAVAVLDTGGSERPERLMALAHALVAAGQGELTADLLSGLPAPPPAETRNRTETLLLQAQTEADPVAQRRLLAQALELARPEQLRRPFIEAAPWVRRRLRRDPELALSHGWLADRLTRPVATVEITDRIPGTATLSARERDVLFQAAQWLSTEEIAAELQISVNTVKTHLKTIYRKLSVHRRGEAVRRAQQLNLL